MLRCFLVILSAIVFAGCAKKVDLPEITVSAADAGAFTQFRSELSSEFPAERLQPFDTAVQELKLDAMNRNIATAEARELDTLRVVDGKSIHAVTLLGWQARHARFLREAAFLNEILERDLKAQQNAGANGPSSTLLAQIESARKVIAQLQSNAAETERRLAEMHATTDRKP
jgi:hypothetical protein